MENCVIYSRVSSTMQDNTSAINDLLKYAKDNNFNVLKEFSEKASGFDPKAERPALKELKEYVIANGIKQILIWSTSRLGRTRRTLDEIEFFTKLGVNIYFKKEGINTLSTDATNRFLLTILSAAADMERENIVDQVRRGRDASALNRKRTGMIYLPYGYKADENGVLVIDDEEAVVVNEIFDLYIQGKTMNKIAAYLRSKEYPTRFQKLNKTAEKKSGVKYAHKWRQTNVSVILNNEIYIGNRIYKKMPIPAPRIIDKTRWDKVQSLLLGNMGYKLRTRHKYLFKGKLFCGHCGYMMGYRTENRYHHQPAYYYCRSMRNSLTECDQLGQFLGNLIDEILYDNVFNDYFSQVNEFFMRDRGKNIDVNEKQKQIINLESEIEILRIKIRRTDRQYRELRIEYPEMVKEIGRYLAEIETCKKTIEEFQREIKSATEFDLHKALQEARRNSDFRTNFDGMLDNVQKYVNKAVVYSVDKYDREEFIKNTKQWDNGNKIGISMKRDKLVYIELFAYDSRRPAKIVLSSWSKRYAAGQNNIWYDQKDKSLVFGYKQED